MSCRRIGWCFDLLCFALCHFPCVVLFRVVFVGYPIPVLLSFAITLLHLFVAFRFTCFPGVRAFRRLVYELHEIRSNPFFSCDLTSWENKTPKSNLQKLDFRSPYFWLMICIRPTFGGKGSFDLHWCPVKINGWMTIKKKSSVIVCTACKIAGGMRIGQDLRALVKKSNIYIYIYVYNICVGCS